MTVYARTLCSTPERSALQTWELVVELVTEGNDEAEAELLSVSGIASSTIASQGPLDSPIVVRGGGPQARIYPVPSLSVDCLASMESSPYKGGCRDTEEAIEYRAPLRLKLCGA